MSIAEEDYKDAARILNCDIAAIQAVAEVESSGSGFLQDGRTLRVLFEGHVFHKYTNGAFADSHPTLCYPKWTKAHYCKGSAEVRGAGEQARLRAAMALDRTAALMSASIGRFQVMGFNHQACGFSDVQQLWLWLGRDEREHLMAFCRFVLHNKLEGFLRTHNWAGFAARYNGAAYAKNAYDVKMAKAYAKYV